MSEPVSFNEWMTTPFKEDYSEIQINIGTGTILIRPQGVIITGEDFPMWCFVPTVVKDINTTLKEMRAYLRPFLGVEIGYSEDLNKLDICIRVVEDNVETQINAVGSVSVIVADHRSGLLTAVPTALVFAG